MFSVATTELSATWSHYESALFTKSELDRLLDVAAKLTSAVSARQNGTPERTKAALDRRRAFTLLVRAYDQVRRSLTWVRWRYDDADQLAPSLWSHGPGTRRNTTDLPTAPSVTSPPDATPVAEPAVPTVAAEPGPRGTPFTT